MFAISDMMRVSLAQYVLVGVITVLFAIFVGQDAAITALIGGLSYAVPTSLLVFFLAIPRMVLRRKVNPGAVIIGEFVKILSVCTLLGLAVRYYENLYWPALIISIIAVANSYFIVLFNRN